MARLVVLIRGRPALDARDLERCQDFGAKLQQAMVMAANANALRLSQIRPEYIGVEKSPKTAAATSGMVRQFVRDSGHNYATAQIDDFASSDARRPFQRAHYGYPIEAETQVKFQEQFGSTYTKAIGASNTEGDYLYNEPGAFPALGFPINFAGTGRGGARPDWRLKLLHSDGEAIFDATSEAQEGHLLRKKVGSRTLDQLPRVLYGAEVIYETKDAYFSTSRGTAWLWGVVICALGATALAFSTYLAYSSNSDG